MKMKEKKFKIKITRFFVITVSFVVFVFLMSLCYGWFATNTNGLLSSSVTGYKWCNVFRIFFRLLPSAFATSFVVAWTCVFGANSEGSRLRFSPAMFARYRRVMIDSIIAVLFISLGTEVFVPLMNEKMAGHRDLPVLLREYKEIAKGLYDQGRYEFADEYAKLAVELDPSDEEAKAIAQKTGLSAEKTNKSDEFKKHEAKQPIESMPKYLMNELDFGKTYTNLQETERSLPDEMTSYKLLLAARACFAKEDWFGAHYYSQMGLKMSSQKDINKIKLMELAADSWNKLSAAREEGDSEDKQRFARKLEGYSALLENDFFRAYYIFRALYLNSKEYSLDPDVRKYLDIAQTNLQKQYFFADETFKLEGFESARNVRFRVSHTDGTVSVVFIRGVTVATSKAGYVQYLRGLGIYRLSDEGKYLYGSYTPYAKMTAVSTSAFTAEEKAHFGIADSIKRVPFLLLRSTDRNNDDVVVGTEVKFGSSSDFENGFYILPMEFDDFDMLKKVSAGVESAGISTLFAFTDKAKGYGFSEEVYTQFLLNRIFYPIYMLILFILLGLLSWHGRVPSGSVFKFKWMIIFPVLFMVSIGAYGILMGFFKVCNYEIVAMAGKNLSLLTGVGLYALALLVVSVLFLASRNSAERNI